MSQLVRMHSKRLFVGYKRGLRNQNENTALVRIEGVQDKKSTDFYLGKRIAYVYRVKKNTVAEGSKKPSKNQNHLRKVTRPHDATGVLLAKFKYNLPAKAFGATLRVMLYPSRV